MDIGQPAAHSSLDFTLIRFGYYGILGRPNEV